MGTRRIGINLHDIPSRSELHATMLRPKGNHDDIPVLSVGSGLWNILGTLSSRSTMGFPRLSHFALYENIISFARLCLLLLTSYKHRVPTSITMTSAIRSYRLPRRSLLHYHYRSIPHQPLQLSILPSTHATLHYNKFEYQISKHGTTLESPRPTLRPACRSSGRK
jgi:hypothetical protein